MITALLPSNEPERLAALKTYCVLDTDPEAGFDDLTAIAAEVCVAPIALVSLVDTDRQWFKSHHGLNATETPRDMAFCAHAILCSEPLIVPDARADARFHDNPLVTGPPRVVFYAGVPLIGSSGHALGTLCVIDHVPRELSAVQLKVLERLSRQVSCLLELRVSQQAAQQAARSKSEFLSTMSHEIRTPLNGILGMTELLGETALSDEQQQYLGIVQRSGKHLLTVVNDILDFSRLESGNVVLETLPVNIHELVADSIAILNETARSKGIALNLEWTSKRPARRIGDAQRLRQVLLNLIGNAIKFTNSGEVTVRINDTNDSNVIEVAVTDTGIGMAPEVLSRLFQRFSQADSSTTRKFGGTGLGLAITKHLVELMGGEISVTSKVAVGSRFVCLLPLAIDAAVATGSDGLPSIGDGDELNLKGKSLLVAEDDDVNLMLITNFLKRYGVDLTVVRNGKAAVAACEARQFDVILMDCMMPEMDGYRATAVIRDMNSEWSKTVPIIALTANAMSGDREECLLSGMSDYLSKPVKRAELELVLSKAARGEASASEAEAVSGRSAAK